MEKLSKLLMNLKTERYTSHLENVSRNIPNLQKNITYYNGNAAIESSVKGKRKLFIFPQYEYVKDTLEALIQSRKELYLTYRYLRSRIINGDDVKVPLEISSEYDRVVKSLSVIDSEIETFETYQKLIYNEVEMQIEVLKKEKKDVQTESLESDISDIDYLLKLNRMKEIDKQIQELQTNYVETWIKKMPKTIILEEVEEKVDPIEEKPKEVKKRAVRNKKTEGVADDVPKEVKKRGRPRKVKVNVGGFIRPYSFINEEKLKNIVKMKLLNNTKKN